MYYLCIANIEQKKHKTYNYAVQREQYMLAYYCRRREMSAATHAHVAWVRHSFIIENEIESVAIRKIRICVQRNVEQGSVSGDEKEKSIDNHQIINASSQSG